MFERFTDQARLVVVLAQDEARLLRHNYIGTEHLLLGLLREREGVGALVLEMMGIDLDAVRRRIDETFGPGALELQRNVHGRRRRGRSGRCDPVPGHIPFTPRAKKVLELSLAEARGFRHDYIGTEHILLGLIREGAGVAADVLDGRGASEPRVRIALIDEIGRRGRETPGCSA